MAEAAVPVQVVGAGIQETGPSDRRGYKWQIFMKEDMNRYEEYECRLCHLILRVPMQAGCGHRFCQRCVTHIFYCPACQEEGEPRTETTNTIQRDYACRNEMKKLSINCENRECGCKWQGKLAGIDDHLKNECAFGIANEKCTRCSQWITWDERTMHLILRCTESREDTGVICMFGCEGLAPDVNIDEHNEQYARQHKDILERNLNELHVNCKGMADVLMTALTGAHLDVDPATRIVVDQFMLEAIEEFNRITPESRTGNEVSNLIAMVMSCLAGLAHRVERIDISEVNPHQSEAGILWWEIDGITEKISKAKGDPQFTVQSPGFYSGKGGYKLQAKLYLSGDGDGLRTHLSLYVMVLQGPNDDQLTWPMNAQIRLLLVDHPEEGDGQHHKQMVATSQASQRPVEAPSVVCSCPQFLSLTEFNQRYAGFAAQDSLWLEIRCLGAAIAESSPEEPGPDIGSD